MDNTGKVDKGCRRKFDKWKSQKKKWINNEKDEWGKGWWWNGWMIKRMNDENDE
jgi:hypothetical protein